MCILHFANHFQVSLQRGFPTDIEGDFYPHTFFSRLKKKKNTFIFAILIGEMGLIFSFIQFCCHMFVGCFRFFLILPLSVLSLLTF